MAVMLTENEVRQRLRNFAISRNGGRRHGSLSTLSDLAGTSRAYVSAVLKGDRPPSDKLLNLIGVERVSDYRQIKYRDKVRQPEQE